MPKSHESPVETELQPRIDSGDWYRCGTQPKETHAVINFGRRRIVVRHIQHDPVLRFQ